jgi:Tol biopolymer transport system component
MTRLHMKKVNLRKASSTAAAAILTASMLGAASAAQAAFPGDNGWISFTSLAEADGQVNDEIFVTTASAVTPIRLTTGAANERDSAVSPNGKEIAFGRGCACAPVVSESVEIYVMDANDDDGDGNGDDLRRLTYNESLDDQLAWSPGGRKLAFRSRRDGNDEIYVTDADGSGETLRLTNGPISDQNPVFSPDGTEIAFASNRSGNFDIYVMDAADEDGDGNGDDLRRLTTNPAGDAWPEFSPDGARLAFGSNRDGDVDVYVMTAAPENAETNVPLNRTNAMRGINSSGVLVATNERWPAWSPDGQKIAVWSGIGTGLLNDAAIWVIDADGSGAPTNVSSTLPGSAWPDWGPLPTTPARD